MRPLREQWEARGPGLLKYVGQQLPWLTLPTQPVIHLVPPQRGGGGRVVTENEIEFEAVLFHPHPALPEVARLAWLLCCASLAAKQGPLALSLIPPIVLGAEHVELASLSETTLNLAVTHWFADQRPQINGSELLHWWTTCASQAKTKDQWLTVVQQL